MGFKKTTLLAFIACSCFQGFCTSEPQGLQWEAKINGKPARFMIDTGCSFPALLFRPGAERLGLQLKEQSSGELNGRSLPLQFTEECLLELPHWGFWSIFHFPVNLRVRAPFVIFGNQANPLPGSDSVIDGVLGWPSFRHTTFRLGGSAQNLEFLKKVPKQAKNWTKLAVRGPASDENSLLWSWHYPLARKVVTSPGLLELELPGGRTNREVLMIDTGDDTGIGVQLSSQKWGEWKAAHPQQVTALRVYALYDGAVMVRESGWASELSLGPLTFKNVSVAESGFGTNHTATLSFASLKRLEMIIDGRRQLAYLRPLDGPVPKTPPAGPTAIFAPQDFNSNEVVGHVLDSSPAFAAGIRNGDLLLQIEGVDFAQWCRRPGEKWRPNTPDSKMLVGSQHSTPGSTIELTVQRNGNTFKATVRQEGIGIVCLADPTAN